MRSRSRSSNDLEEILTRLKSVQDAGEKTQQPLAAIDPTANVLKFVDGQVTRINDLRDTDIKWQDKIRRIEEGCKLEILSLTNKLQKAESKRIDAVGLAESRRLDALLAANTSNVSLAAEKNTAQAQTLATQLVSTAEALRSQVASTSSATQSQISTLGDTLGKRITQLEQNQYQGVGTTLQRSESKQDTRWTMDKLILIAITLLGWVFLYLRTKP